MKILHYLEIENFKQFGERQRIELDHPTVLIGPNNCGKTTALQAIALWSHAVRHWWDAKGANTPQDEAASLVRSEIISVPVRRTRHYWRDLAVSDGDRDIPLRIALGMEHDGKVEPVGMRFRSHENDLVYCIPEEETLANRGLLRSASRVKVDLLYPMSGLEMDEPVLLPARIRSLLGEGRTAPILRNLCLEVYGASQDDWREIAERMQRLFSIELGEPAESARGTITLEYRRAGIREPLDLSLAGRGMQQVLLLLAYLYCDRGRVLLIDEPDAHLELLRQRQVHVLLRDLAAKRDTQIVLATHSEEVLREALDHNLTLLIDGRAEPLAGKVEITDALRHFGAEHYVRARQSGYVLYLEGRTDLELLRALAGHLGHAVLDRWDEMPNVFFVRDNHPDPDLDSELERVEGGYGVTPQRHFFGIRGMAPGLLGLAILDSNGRSPTDTDDGGLRIAYWRRYEIENYFITPAVLEDYALSRYGDATLFAGFRAEIESVLDTVVRERVFGGSERDFITWKGLDADAARLLWEARTERLKVSAVAEAFFEALAERLNRSVLLRKRDFRELVRFVPRDAVPSEVGEKLDLLKGLFDGPEPGAGD